MLCTGAFSCALGGSSVGGSMAVGSVSVILMFRELGLRVSDPFAVRCPCV